MKQFKCDLCSEELDSRRQAFKHFDKVHGGAGTVTSLAPRNDPDQFGTTSSLEVVSQHFLILPKNDEPDGHPEGNPEDPQSGSDSEMEVKEVIEGQEDCILPHDLVEDENLVGMTTPDPESEPDLERDPLSQLDFEEDTNLQPDSPSQQLNVKAAIQRNIRSSIEDIAKNIIVQELSQFQTDKLNGQTCPRCARDFKTTKDMRSHFRLAHFEKYQCTLCSRKFTSRVNILKHVCIPKFPSSNCSKGSSRVPERRIRPPQTKRNKKPAAIKSPPSNSEKTETLAVEPSSYPEGSWRSYKCIPCDIQFPDRHRYRHHNDKFHSKKEKKFRFSCELCSKTFASRSGVRRHERREHSPSDIDELDEEDKSEDSNPKCICDLCKLGYDCSSILKGRKTVHLKEGEYPCDICGRRFSEGEILKKHRSEKHPGIRFFCEEGCGVSFFSSRNLDLHKKRCPIYKMYNMSCGDDDDGS